MINENTSPEEKLFKIIQQGKRAPLNSDNGAQKKIGAEWISALKRAILIWKEREVWQYLALYNVPVNQLYGEGYRSLGCAPCTKITNEDNERAGRWIGTSKCGGECGIHTRPLKERNYGSR